MEAPAVFTVHFWPSLVRLTAGYNLAARIVRFRVSDSLSICEERGASASSLDNDGVMHRLLIHVGRNSHQSLSHPYSIITWGVVLEPNSLRLFFSDQSFNCGANVPCSSAFQTDNHREQERR